MRHLTLKAAAAVLTAAVACNTISAGGKTVRGYTVTPQGDNPGIGLALDSVEYRKDLTRVYCRIIGRPSTSHRIDSVAIGGSPATDIDGVDMKRWFQWEEEGEISLEIDLAPAAVAPGEMEIFMLTPRGAAIWKAVGSLPAVRKR